MQQNTEMVAIMFKRARNYVFFMAVYLFGILIGGVYTPDVVSYAKQIDVFKNAEQEQIQQKPQQIRKKQRKTQLTGLR